MRGRRAKSAFKTPKVGAYDYSCYSRIKFDYAGSAVKPLSTLIETNNQLFQNKQNQANWLTGFHVDTSVERNVSINKTKDMQKDDFPGVTYNFSVCMSR